jgi:peptidoglycan/LPS O-acetylase OafA/YrhL
LITKRERRFIRSWQEQREGGRWSYYLLYTFVGGFIIALVIYILTLWIFQVRVPRPYWVIPAIGVVSSGIIAVIVWRVNENRLKKIIRREISAGNGSLPDEKGT